MVIWSVVSVVVVVVVDVVVLEELVFYLCLVVVVAVRGVVYGLILLLVGICLLPHGSTACLCFGLLVVLLSSVVVVVVVPQVVLVLVVPRQVVCHRRCHRTRWRSYLVASVRPVKRKSMES